MLRRRESEDGCSVVAVFVFTEWGDVLLLRRPHGDPVEGGRWGVLERDVPDGQSSREAATREISDCLKLTAEGGRLKELSSAGRIGQEADSTAQSAASTTTVALYAYTLSWEQYQAVQDRRPQFVETVCEGGGPSSQGTPVPLLRFLAAKKLLEHAQAFPAEFARSTLEVLRQPLVERAIAFLWSELVGAARKHVIEVVVTPTGHIGKHQDDDTVIMDAVLPRPRNAAAEFEVQRVFNEGKQTCGGAYYIGQMMDVAGHLRAWNEKLSDPYRRYVEEELALLRRGIEDDECRKALAGLDVEEACRFVREVLHFPLENGVLLRFTLSNLEEIAAGRRALRWYVRSLGILPENLIDNPIKRFSQACNEIVCDVWRTKGPRLSDDDEALRSLLRLNVLLNTLDFKNVEFMNVWSDPDKFRAIVEAQFEAALSASFAPELGGDAFVDEFLDRWLPRESSRPISLVYLTDNNGQLAVSLKCIEAFLRRCPRLCVTVVPKDGQFGNDTSWRDLEDLLKEDRQSPNSVFSELRRLQKRKRWSVCRNGPCSEGLDPRSLSRELCFHLNGADVIFAEGRAYAQIRGWRRPSYLLFPVKGRVAEAIHGVSGSRSALAFVRAGGGIAHFSHPNLLPSRMIIPLREPERSFHASGQTTADYVNAILSENYRILRDEVFGGRENALLERLQAESSCTGRPLSEIVLGTTSQPGPDRAKRLRAMDSVDVFAIGGGGGFNHVTLKALRQLDVSVVAGVTSTDDGGSTGQLQKMLAGKYGYVFGMGDGAAILEEQTDCSFKKRLLSYRCPPNTISLRKVVTERAREAAAASMDCAWGIADCPDFLLFVAEQLNLARVIDENFLGDNEVPGFRVDGASIRNLNILAAFHACNALGRPPRGRPSRQGTDETNTERAWALLEGALGLRVASGKVIRVVPVSYEQAVLWAKYDKPVPPEKPGGLNIPREAISKCRKTVYGQQYIDQIVPTGKIVDFGLVHSIGCRSGPKPRPSQAYLLALRSASLIVVGAGSLYGSQLAQLAVPGVMDAILTRTDIRRVFVANHVCMNETSSYSLTDHVQAVERLANQVTSGELRQRLGLRRRIRIGDVFSDIVVPRTVAREIDLATAADPKAASRYVGWKDLRNPEFVTPDGKPSDKDHGILRNRYVAYVLDNRKFRDRQQITNWELRILGFLEQPPELYHSRSEAGRYRGAVYATEDDVQYLIKQGIPRRHIYEVESIAMNTKFLKAPGDLSIEEFPGLIAESLVGIFRILLDKGQCGGRALPQRG